MIRRSRISVRPNVRPGGRGPSSSQECQASQGAGAGPPAAADTTHAAETEGKEPESAAAPEPPGGWSADTARVNDSQDQAPDKVSPNLGEGGQNGGTIGDNPVGAAALQRRKRFSAMPNLTKPRVTPTPTRAPIPSTAESPVRTVAAPPSPADTPVAVHEDQTLEQDRTLLCVGSPSRQSVSVEEEQTTSQEKPGPALPATPSTSCQDPSPEKAEDQTQPLDPQNASEEKVPSSSKLPLPEPFSPRRRNSSSSVSSEGASPSNLPLKVSGDTEDRKKLVKAYKLKEMMKLERSKERVGSHRSGRRHGVG